MLKALAGRVGLVLGAASSCLNIPRSRINSISDKITGVIKSSEGSAAIFEVLNSSEADGARPVAAKQIDCATAERQLAEIRFGASLPLSGGEAPDYISLEYYVAAQILIEALKRAGPQLDTEKLVDVLESIHDLDVGLGALINFNGSEHQGSHKIWGTQLVNPVSSKPLSFSRATVRNVSKSLGKSHDLPA